MILVFLIPRKINLDGAPHSAQIGETMYRIGEKTFATIEEAGKEYAPGSRISLDDGSPISSREVDQAMGAWLRNVKDAGKKKEADK